MMQVFVVSINRLESALSTGRYNACMPIRNYKLVLAVHNIHIIFIIIFFFYILFYEFDAYSYQ